MPNIIAIFIDVKEHQQYVLTMGMGMNDDWAKALECNDFAVYSGISTEDAHMIARQGDKVSPKRAAELFGMSFELTATNFRR